MSEKDRDTLKYRRRGPTNSLYQIYVLLGTAQETLHDYQCHAKCYLSKRGFYLRRSTLVKLHLVLCLSRSHIYRSSSEKGSFCNYERTLRHCYSRIQLNVHIKLKDKN